MKLTRSFRVFSSHGFGQSVTLLTNLILPTVFLRNLGAESLGIWITANAITLFLVQSDFGVSSSLVNSIKSGEKINLDKTFKWAIRTTLYRAVASVVVLNMLVAAYVYIGVGRFIDHSSELQSVIFWLSFVTALSPVPNLLTALLKVDDAQFLGILSSNCLRLVDFFAVCVGIFLFGTVFAAAVAAAAFRITTSLAIIGVVIRGAYIKTASRYIQTTDCIATVKQKAFQNFYSALAPTISLHAPTLIIAYSFNSTIVATYAVTRTLARIPAQFIGILVETLSVEQNHAHHQLDYRRVRYLLYFGLCIITVLLLACMLVTLLLTSVIQEYWLHNKLELKPQLLSLLIAQVGVSMCTNAVNATLVAIGEAIISSRILITGQLASVASFSLFSTFQSLEAGVTAAVIIETFVLLAVVSNAVEIKRRLREPGR